jgi:Helicase associated domain
LFFSLFRPDIWFSLNLQFKEEIGHCRVPKGYSKDPELANWVRNQRLEQANFEKKKKSRMTPDRFKLLDELGFKWSSPTPSRSRKYPKKVEEGEGKEGSFSDDPINETEGAVLDEAVATAAAAAAVAAVEAGLTVEPTYEAKEAGEQGETKNPETEATQIHDSAKEEVEVPSLEKEEDEVASLVKAEAAPFEV